MSDDSANPRPALDADEDLYCLHCGYNLRGLLGNPRRCPECDRESSVEDMRALTPLLRKQADRLETLPWLCVAAVGLGLALGSLFLLFSPIIGVLLFLAAGAGWVLSARAFATRCERRAGWRFLILQFHAVAVLFIAPVVGLFVARAPAFALQKGPGLDALVLLSFVMFMGAGVLVYRDARRRLVPLRRTAAVELARRELLQEAVSRRLLGRVSLVRSALMVLGTALGGYIAVRLLIAAIKMIWGLDAPSPEASDIIAVLFGALPALVFVEYADWDSVALRQRHWAKPALRSILGFLMAYATIALGFIAVAVGTGIVQSRWGLDPLSGQAGIAIAMGYGSLPPTFLLHKILDSLDWWQATEPERDADTCPAPQDHTEQEQNRPDGMDE